jgi:hypothetical protein
MTRTPSISLLLKNLNVAWSHCYAPRRQIDSQSTRLPWSPRTKRTAPCSAMPIGFIALNANFALCNSYNDGLCVIQTRSSSGMQFDKIHLGFQATNIDIVTIFNKIILIIIFAMAGSRG